MRQESSPDLATLDLERLRIIHYPDPRLRQRCQPVTAFDDALQALVERMLRLMETGKGVGLAASQLGVLQRIFVMNPTGQPGDEHVFVNPVLKDMHGSVEAEEGCLSLPGVSVRVRRAQRCRVEAQDVRGRPFSLEVQDLPARVCQHEYDHLNGVLLIDRMGPSDRLATRKILRALEEQYRSSNTRSR